LIFLEREDIDKVLSEIHDGPVEGHFGGHNTTHKLLIACYYWPTLFKDSHDFPLQPFTIEFPFQQWGLDVIEEINPNSSKLHKYIITTTNYFTR